MESLTSQNILQWLENPNNLMIAGGAAAVLLLVAIWLLVRRRRRSAEKKGREERAEEPVKRTDLQDVFESYRLTHPAFYSLVKSVQERHPLTDFSENREFTGAVAKLRLIQAARRASRPTAPRAAMLRLEADRGGDTSREGRAAMLTIIRILYASPEVRAALRSEEEAELDRLVESLTA